MALLRVENPKLLVTSHHAPKGHKNDEPSWHRNSADRRFDVNNTVDDGWTGTMHNDHIRTQRC